MIDTPPQDKLYKHSHVVNVCEQSCIMKIMEDSKKSKTEYLKIIMYPANDTPHKLCNIREIKISSNPDHHPLMQADPCVSSDAPSLGSSGEPGHPLFDFVVFREGGSQREGCKDANEGISPCANRMGKHAYQAHFDGKYTS